MIFCRNKENKIVHEYYQKVYSIFEMHLVSLNQTKTAKTAALDHYLPMLVIVTSFFLPESPGSNLIRGFQAILNISFYNFLEFVSLSFCAYKIQDSLFQKTAEKAMISISKKEIKTIERGNSK